MFRVFAFVNLNRSPKEAYGVNPAKKHYERGRSGRFLTPTTDFTGQAFDFERILHPFTDGWHFSVELTFGKQPVTI
jgi:hypothetical protein